MKFLALDVGEKRVGIATSDPLGVGVWPQKTFYRQGTDQDFEKLAELIEEQGLQALVVGLPLNMNESEGPQAKKVRQFIEKLQIQMKQRNLTLPVYWQDERLTSWAAEEKLVEKGIRGKKKKEEVDSMAACLILEDYLRSKGKL